MSVEEEKNHLRALDAWFFSVQGENLASAFQEEMAIFRDRLQGSTFLQLGSCGRNSWLTSLAFSHQYIVSPFPLKSKSFASPQSYLLSSLTTLPFESESIDCLLVPLTMHAFSYQKNPLDEMDRILKPMGQVIFFGVNPFSFWGLWLQANSRFPLSVSLGERTSLYFIKHNMLHRGYFQCRMTNFYYIPPWVKKENLDKWALLNQLGKVILPYPAGFYCLVLQKFREDPSSLLEPDLEGEQSRMRWRRLEPAW